MSEEDMAETVDPKLFVVLFIGIVIGYFVAGGSVLPGDDHQGKDPGIQDSFDKDGKKVLDDSMTVPGECKDVSEVKKDMCIANLAIDRENVSLCKVVESSSVESFCTGYIEREKEECEKVDDEFLRNKCLNRVKGDVITHSYEKVPSSCEGVEETRMDMCISNVAINRSDVSLCSQPVTEEVRNYCYGMVTGNRTRCEKVDDEFLRDNCLDSSTE